MKTNRKTKEQTNNDMKDNINIIDSFTFTSTSFLNLADHLQTSSKYMIAANVFLKMKNLKIVCGHIIV